MADLLVITDEGGAGSAPADLRPSAEATAAIRRDAEQRALRALSSLLPAFAADQPDALSAAAAAVGEIALDAAHALELARAAAVRQGGAAGASQHAFGSGAGAGGGEDGGAGMGASSWLSATPASSCRLGGPRAQRAAVADAGMQTVFVPPRRTPPSGGQHGARGGLGGGRGSLQWPASPPGHGHAERGPGGFGASPSRVSAASAGSRARGGRSHEAQRAEGRRAALVAALAPIVRPLRSDSGPAALSPSSPQWPLSSRWEPAQPQAGCAAAASPAGEASPALLAPDAARPAPSSGGAGGVPLRPSAVAPPPQRGAPARGGPDGGGGLVWASSASPLSPSSRAATAAGRGRAPAAAALAQAAAGAPGGITGWLAVGMPSAPAEGAACAGTAPGGAALGEGALLEPLGVAGLLSRLGEGALAGPSAGAGARRAARSAVSIDNLLSPPFCSEGALLRRSAAGGPGAQPARGEQAGGGGCAPEASRAQA